MTYQEAKKHGEFDKAGRFWIAPESKASCCANIRRPSRAYPYSQLKHLMTKRHDKISQQEQEELKSCV